MAALVAALVGCAAPPTAGPSSPASPASPSTAPVPTGAAAASDDCARWAEALDRAVAAAGVGDAEAERIAGQPYLRVDRIGAALRERALAAEAPAAAWTAWLARAAALDADGRSAEIANLPDTVFPLAEAADRPAARARTEACRARALQTLAQRPATPPAWFAAAGVPDRYADWQRALGLYPLSRLPFLRGVERWQDEHRERMSRWATSPPPLQPWSPPAAEAPPGGPWPRDALGLPLADGALQSAWLAWHAPGLEIETAGPGDRWGAPRWRAAGRPDVDTGRAVVYGRVTAARVGERWQPQLVYTLWFGERAPTSAFDALAGALDGVIVRLTLDDQGRVLLVDSIHACGCYHLFFPSAALRPRPGAPADQEWLFVPRALPEGDPAARLVVRLTAHDHQLAGLAWAGRGSAAGARYTLAPEAELRSLPLDAGRRSLYGPDGQVAGTERGERWFFWPMGIPSAGAMRQWGHHATAFVGRRHFDDVDLIDARLERVPASDRPAPAPGSSP